MVGWAIALGALLLGAWDGRHFVFAAAGVTGQTQPRTPWGDPDLQGP